MYNAPEGGSSRIEDSALNAAELEALNQTFADVERAINNLNARLQATMAYAASLPGADRVNDADIQSRLALTAMAPVLDGGQRAPQEFVDEAFRELGRMACEPAARKGPKVRTGS